MKKLLQYIHYIFHKEHSKALRIVHQIDLESCSIAFHTLLHMLQIE